MLLVVWFLFCFVLANDLCFSRFCFLKQKSLLARHGQVHTCYAAPQEAEAGGLQVLGQLGEYSETISK
jgi:hypothetical protein